MSIELELDQDAALEFCVRLVQVLRLIRLYQVENVNLGPPIQGLLELTERVASHAGRVRVEVDQGTVFFNRDPVRGGRKAFGTVKELSSSLDQLGIAAIALGEGLSVPELRTFFGLIKPPQGGPHPIPKLKAGLEAAGISDRIQIYAPDEITSVQTEQTEIDEATFFPQAYARTLVLVREYVKNMHVETFRRDLDAKLSRALRDLTCLVPKFPHKFLAMGSIKGLDAYLFSHMANTGFLSFLLGYHLGITRVRLSDLAYCAMLHALGMAKLPARLHESVSLSKEDLSQLGEHPYRALAELLGTRRSTTKNLVAASVCFQYGRHRKLTEFRVPPERHPFAMIVRICEEYDALTSTFPDRPALSPTQALAQLLGNPRHYDPSLLAVFAWMVGPLPPGTVVRLTSGEVALVVKPNEEERLRPVVAMVRDASGQALGSARYDLTEKAPNGEYPSSVAEILDRVEAGVDLAAHMLAS